MNTIQIIGKNISVYLIGQIFASALSFVFFTLTARYLGVQEFGAFSFALAAVAIFGSFSDLGLRQVIARDVARNRSLAKKYLVNGLAVKFVFSCISISAFLFYARFFSPSLQARNIAFLMAFSIFIISFLQAFYGLFQAYQKNEIEAGILVLKNLLFFLSIIIVGRFALSPLLLVAFYLLSEAIAFVFSIVILKKNFKDLKAGIDNNFIIELLLETFPFALTAIFGMVNHWAGILILAAVSGETAVGWYSASQRIFLALLLLPSAFGAALYPIMSRLHVESKDKLKLTTEKYLRYLIILALPVVVGTYLLAPKIIVFFFGAEYLPATYSLRILTIAAASVFIASPFSNLLNSTDKQIVLAKIIGVSAVVNVFAVILLLPLLGFLAVAAANALSFSFISILIFKFVYRENYHFNWRLLAETFIKGAGASSLAGLFVLVFYQISTLILLGFFACAYFIFFFLLKGFDVFDRGVLLEFFKIAGMKLISKKTKTTRWQRMNKNINMLLKSPYNLIYWALNKPLKPRWMIFLPTNACNSHCTHCSIWKETPDPNPLSPKELENIFTDPLLKKVEWVMLSGGEPTLRTDLSEIVLAIHKALPQAGIQISTNAILPQRALETAKTALENGVCFEVGVSLDGIGEKHDKVRGVPGNFEKADRLLKELIELREIYPQRFNVAAGIVISDLTLKNLEEVRHYAKDLCINLVEAWYNEAPFYDNLGRHHHKEGIMEAVKSQPASLIKEKWLDLLRDRPIRFPCFAGSTFAVIKCNGDVTPCLSLWNQSLGNLRQDSFTKIWHSPEAKKIRSQVKKCQGCLNGWGAGWSFKTSMYQTTFFYLKHPRLLIKKFIS